VQVAKLDPAQVGDVQGDKDGKVEKTSWMSRL